MEHPEHKIYRKSAIRFSILQRIRHIMSEEQRKNQKYPVYKQGSKSMGEKIAHPDYVDPQKLLLGSRNCSQIDLTDNKAEECDFLGEPELLDLTINEKEVLSEIEKRLNESTVEPDTGQTNLNSSRSTTKSEISLNSSQNSDSYYECILENSLTEEYIRDSSGKLVVKNDSFSSNESRNSFTQKYKFFETTSGSPTEEKKPVVKRPTKAPPPIPIKPLRLTSNASTKTVVASRSSTTTTSTTSVNGSGENGTSTSTTEVRQNTSWVKTMVGRFE